MASGSPLTLGPIDVVYRQERDRWIRGDRFVRPAIRRILRGRASRLSGMERVVANFLKGLALRGVTYHYNRPSFMLRRSPCVISFGLGEAGLKGLGSDTPIIAAIGFPDPTELPALCDRYRIVKVLQHSQWVLDFLRAGRNYPDGLLDLWPAGVDTDEWRPTKSIGEKPLDVLIYKKFIWDREAREADLLCPIREILTRNGVSYTEISYGGYVPSQYKEYLTRTKAMVFLSPHESQGLAYQEALSSGVPVLAWNQGTFLDPARFAYRLPVIPATSVPFFDERCGATFSGIDDFETQFGRFFDRLLARQYRPRDFVIDNLTLGGSTERMLTIYHSVAKQPPRKRKGLESPG